MKPNATLRGERTILEREGELYPVRLLDLPNPPEALYVVGNPYVLSEPSIAVIGARRCTPYGRGCARRFSKIAAERAFSIVNGGARGIDGEALRAALEAGGKPVAVLGGGCDRIYPHEHAELFQEIVDAGGAVVSEQAWDASPKPYAFRARNRIVAALARAVLVIEAGVPSGTLSTADEALSAGRDVLVVPGAITAAQSKGPNMLLVQGATPIVDDANFESVLAAIA